jgi:hypothetical protein
MKTPLIIREFSEVSTQLAVSDAVKFDYIWNVPSW